MSGLLLPSTARVGVKPLSYKRLILGRSPLGYWRMGDASSPVQDETTGNRDMTITGATLGATGLLAGDPDKGTDFDGVNDLGSIGSLTVTANATIEAWIKADTWQTVSPEINNVFGVEVTGNVLELRIGSPGFSGYPELITVHNSTTRTTRGPAALSTGTIYHIVGVASGAQALLYVNGALVTTGNYAGVNAATGNYYVGVFPGTGSGRWFDGIIDEVAVYNAALTADEVRMHYVAGIRGAKLGLAGSVA